jgi:hypothetical protein
MCQTNHTEFARTDDIEALGLAIENEVSLQLALRDPPDDFQGIQWWCNELFRPPVLEGAIRKASYARGLACCEDETTSDYRERTVPGHPSASEEAMMHHA